MNREIIKNIFGYLAAACLVSTQIPQIYHTYKTKKTDDLSVGFLCLQLITCMLFLTYGIILYEAPLIVANSLVLIESLILFIFKLKYDNSKTTHV